MTSKATIARLKPSVPVTTRHIREVTRPYRTYLRHKRMRSEAAAGEYNAMTRTRMARRDAVNDRLGSPLSYGLLNQHGDSAMARSTNGGGGNGNQIEAERQRVLLGTIRVVSFAANPTTVTPFGTTTLSWQVQVPTNLNFPVSIIVNGQQVGTSGTLTVTVVTQTEVQLAAASPLASVPLKALPLTLDQSGCQPLSLPATLVTGSLQQQLTDRFSGSKSFTLRAGGVTVTPFDDYVNVAIPLDLHVPDWFDATMDIAIELGIATTADISSVVVTQPSTNVNINWTWIQNIVGCSDFGA
jgi:hypothetical protein